MVGGSAERLRCALEEGAVRRFVGFVSVVLLLVVGQCAPVAAQEATPSATGARLEALGLPELRVTATDEAIDMPREVGAGRYLVVLENSAAHGVEAQFVLLPAGVTLEQTLATPRPEDADMPPAWFYEATLAGGLFAAPGATERVVLDLDPAGEWYVDVGRDLEAGGEGATRAGHDLPLTVTEGDAAPGASAEPPAEATAEMRDFDFVIPSVPHGRLIWRVTNTGTQPHHIILFRAPAGVSEEQVMEALAFEFGMAPEGATPSPDLPSPESFAEAGGTAVLSAGRTMWLESDLAPGTYVAVCFVPDPATRTIHAVMGMVELFTVGDGGAGGTPAA